MRKVSKNLAGAREDTKRTHLSRNSRRTLQGLILKAHLKANEEMLQGLDFNPEHLMEQCGDSGSLKMNKGQRTHRFTVLAQGHLTAHCNEAVTAETEPSVTVPQLHSGKMSSREPSQPHKFLSLGHFLKANEGSAGLGYHPETAAHKAEKSWPRENSSHLNINS